MSELTETGGLNVSEVSEGEKTKELNPARAYEGEMSKQEKQERRQLVQEFIETFLNHAQEMELEIVLALEDSSMRVNGVFGTQSGSKAHHIGLATILLDTVKGA